MGSSRLYGAFNKAGVHRNLNHLFQPKIDPGIAGISDPLKRTTGAATPQRFRGTAVGRQPVHERLDARGNTDEAAFAAGASVVFLKGVTLPCVDGAATAFVTGRFALETDSGVPIWTDVPAGFATDSEAVVFAISGAVAFGDSCE